jgi:hypothetical protein
MDKHVSQDDLVKARNAAVAVVSDMPDGPLKDSTYQTILSELVQYALAHAARESDQAAVRSRKGKVGGKPTGTTPRLLNLIEEGFFAQPRSLTEIRESLDERGFHYRLEDLGTPLRRMVRRRHLRRSQAAVHGKKIWRYSNY